MRSLRALLAGLVACAWLLLPGAVSALTLSPPTFDLVADPGQVVTQTLKVRNEADTSSTFTVSAASFSGVAGDETKGIPDFYPANEERDGRGLGSWMAFPLPEFTLAPGERIDLPFTIAVPREAGPGSYFGAIVLSTKTERASDQVGVAGTAAVLVFARVRGAIVEDLRLSGFSAPLMSGSLPVRFEARVENKGTVHLRPYGEIAIKNVFGQVVATLALNRADNKSVLPGAVRRYAAYWQGHTLESDASILARQWQNFRFGPYTAELTLRYGEQERVIQTRTRFWVIPWFVLLLAAGGFLLLVWGLRCFLAWYAKRVLLRYEKRE